MSTVLKTLRLKEEEDKLIKEYAVFNGVGESTFIKNIILEYLEEQEDIKESEKIYKDILTGKEKLFTSEEAEKLLNV